MTSFVTELLEFDDKPKSLFQKLSNGLSDLELNKAILQVSSSDDFTDPCKAWLYKVASHRSIEFGQPIIDWIKDRLITSDEWHCLLNILQSSDWIFETSTFQASGFQQTLYNRFHYLLSHENKMINAWAYHGLIRLSHFNAELRPSVLQMMRLANKDESGSIIARIRNSIKKYPIE